MLILDHLSDPLPAAPAGYVWIQDPGRPHQYSLAWDAAAAAARSHAETAEWTRRHGDSLRLPWEG